MNQHSIGNEKMTRVDPGLGRTRLHQDASASRIVVAHGAAGWGKTTFLRQQATHWNAPTIWFECDGLDRTASAFEQRLARHLGGRDETLSGAVEALDDKVIIIDEVDRVGAPIVASVLNGLVARLPATCRLAVGTRRLDVLQDLERWRVSADLACISSHDLRFRLWEVDRLFREVYGEELTVDEIHQVASASGGWPVALHYFGVALRNSPAADRSHLISTLGRSNAQLRRYLRTQVLGALPDDRRSSLRRLAVLDRIDPERARHFAPEILGELTDLVNTGVLEEGPAAGTFRMHSLLRAELLDELAAERSEVRVRDLYLEAAQVLERVGESHEAGLARSRAGHVDSAESTIDAVTLHAEGTRELYSGNVVSAQQKLERAVALFADEGGNRHATRLLRLVNDWMTGSPGDSVTWAAAVRTALEGRQPNWSGPHGSMVDAVSATTRGDFPLARTLFADATHDNTSPTVVIASALGAGLVALMMGDEHDSSIFGARAWANCRDDGSDAFALVAEALMLAGDLALDDIETVVGIAEHREDLVLSAALHLIASLVGARLQRRNTEHTELAITALTEAGLNRMTSVVEHVVRQQQVVWDRGLHAEAADTLGALSVSCLGGFEVTIDGQVLDLGELRPIHREVLAVLASQTGSSVHREELFEAIWPGRGGDAAKRSLHTAISAIRCWFEDHHDPRGRDRIKRSGEGYALEVDPLDTDLGELLAECRGLREAIRNGTPSLDNLRHMLDSYIDEPFRSFGPVDWAVDVRQSVKATTHDVLLAARPHLDDSQTREWEALWQRAAAICHESTETVEASR